MPWSIQGSGNRSARLDDDHYYPCKLEKHYLFFFGRHSKDSEYFVRTWHSTVSGMLRTLSTQNKDTLFFSLDRG
jgi:hypothetical protein